MKTNKIIKASILAGIFISIGGWAYLAIGGIVGMVAFAFGLLGVVHFGATLYTGTAGFSFDYNDGKDYSKYWKLPLILLFNVIGCILIGMLTRFSSLELSDAAHVIVISRANGGFIQSVMLGIGCGIIMTTAVAFCSEGKYLPLLFGVPVFIACGFQHSIADAFYIATCPVAFLKIHWVAILTSWVGVVLGNFIGCNVQYLLGYKMRKAI